MKVSDTELKHVDLVLTPEQFDTLLDFYPKAIKDVDQTTIVLMSYWRSERYGVVHVTVNNPQ